MIDRSHKQKLLKELEKSGNVYLSCLKSNIARSTFYKWMQEDNWFKKTAIRALRQGRENNCDVGEHALMLKVKDKDLGAIKYLLSNNSPRYKQRRISNATIDHRRSGKLVYKASSPQDFQTTSALGRIRDVIEGFRKPEDLSLEDALDATAEIRLISNLKSKRGKHKEDEPPSS